MQRITYLYKMLKIPKNSAEKLNFWLIFETFLITPSYAHLVTPQFLLKIKGLMEMYNRDKCHLYNISGWEVKKFEMFSWRWRIHEMTHFGVFLIHNCPKYGWILLKFLPLKNLWKIGIFTKTGDTQSLHLWFSFEPNLPPEDGWNRGKVGRWKQKFSHRAV